MKNTIPMFIFIIFMTVSSLAAVTGQIGLTPYTGMYGLNMASMKYQGGTDTWVHGTVDNLTPEQSMSTYTNDHIIALGGVYDIKAGAGETINSENTFYEISVNCPGGFYLRSQSHPSSIRPFYLKLISRYDSPAGVTTGEVIEIRNDGQPETIRWNDNSSSNATRMWFDLILVLPNDSESVINSGFIVADNIQYPLMQATDYTALVTISITFNGRSQSISIPFSGFYDGDTASFKGANTVSLMFTPTGRAANMVIGEYVNVPVGHIDFMMDVTTEGGDSLTDAGDMPSNENYHNDSAVRLFLSASPDPTISTGSFLLRHSSVRSNTVLTDYNSIGYKVILRGDESDGNGSGNTSDNSHVSSKTREFDGSDYILSNKTIQNDNAVYPVRHVTKKEESLTVTSRNIREYFEYHGDIEVLINRPTTVMLPGAYTSNVYIHVVADDTV